MNNTVSVITRTRRRTTLLWRALSSVGAQRLPQDVSLEWVIVNDDDPQPGVEEVVKAARAREIDCKLIHTGQSQGAGRAAAANAGVRASSGGTYLLHDDDDTLGRGALDKMLHRLNEEPDFVGCACGVEEIVETGPLETLVEQRRSTMFKRDLPLSVIEIAYRNPVPPIGLLIRRSAYDAAGGYDDNLPVLEDWEFLLKVVLQGDVDCLAETLAFHHLRQSEGDAANSADALHQRWDIIIRNRMLRQDIATGVAGLAAHGNVRNRVTDERLTRLLQSISQVSKHFSRLRR